MPSIVALPLDDVLLVVSPPTLADSSVQQSDCDAQLFIHLTFSQVVKVQSLLIQCAESVREMAPTKASVCAPSFLPCGHPRAQTTENWAAAVMVYL